MGGPTVKWYSLLPGSARPGVTPAEIAVLARNHRHAVLNILQVASGWLQLGRGDAALEYLEQAKARIDQTSSLSRLGDPNLEAAFILSQAQAEYRGVAVTISAGEADPAYLAEAAAGWREGTLTPQVNHCSASEMIATALPPLVAHIVTVGASQGVTELEIAAGTEAGLPVLYLRMPAQARSLIGIEETVLPSLGFAPTAAGQPGALGLEWRGGHPETGSVELVLTAGPPR